MTNSDFPTDQTFHQFHDLYTELDLHRIMSGFHGAFATGVASQQGTLTLPDTWFRPPFWDLLMLQLLRPNSSSLPCLYPTFHFEYPLVLSRFCILSGSKIVKRLRRRQYDPVIIERTICLVLGPFTFLYRSFLISVALTRRLGLYDGPCLNLLRGDRVLIPVPSDC